VSWPWRQRRKDDDADRMEHLLDQAVAEDARRSVDALADRAHRDAARWVRRRDEVSEALTKAMRGRTT